MRSALSSKLERLEAAMPQKKMDVRVSLITSSEECEAALTKRNVVYASEMLIVSITDD